MPEREISALFIREPGFRKDLKKKHLKNLVYDAKLNKKGNNLFAEKISSKRKTKKQFFEINYFQEIKISENLIYRK